MSNLLMFLSSLSKGALWAEEFEEIRLPSASEKGLNRLHSVSEEGRDFTGNIIHLIYWKKKALNATPMPLALENKIHDWIACFEYDKHV